MKAQSSSRWHPKPRAAHSRPFSSRANTENPSSIYRDQESATDPAHLLQKFVDAHKIETLNVAGSRESKEPGIRSWVMEVLENAFFWSENHPGMLGGPGEG